MFLTAVVHVRSQQAHKSTTSSLFINNGHAPSPTWRCTVADGCWKAPSPKKARRQ
ncbi:hypothetical protein HanIR_Chr11g0555161 [Helianthus annuus]|nr:hypothetical protein HanIR_Chr11g0555161 [Helianthus annuus]